MRRQSTDNRTEVNKTLDDMMKTFISSKIASGEVVLLRADFVTKNRRCWRVSGWFLFSFCWKHNKLYFLRTPL